jgi:hypothetical protein
MKNLIILLLTSTALFSCQKENFKPKGENLQMQKMEKTTSTTKIDVIHLFFDETQVASGHVNFYSGQNLSYVHNFTTADLQDTLLNQEVNCKFIKFTRYVSNAEIRQNNGWFYVNTYFDGNVSALNTIYVNNRMALNGNEALPEPAFVMIQGNDTIINFFKVTLQTVVKPTRNLVQI